MSLPQYGASVSSTEKLPPFSAPKPQGAMEGAKQESTTQFNANGASPGAMNAVAYAQNAATSPSVFTRNSKTSISQLPTSAQEILKRVSASTNVNAESPEWAAAREQVLKSMASSNERHVPFSRPRGRGRGRPRSGTFHSADRTDTAAAAVLATDNIIVAPVRRGRGGRPRGSRGSRGRGRGGRRKRDEDSDGGLSDSDDDKSDDSYSLTTTPTVTKSGRSITKPSPFNPAPQQSPTNGTKRKRPYHRKEVDQILCVRCSRGHSPPSNQIVLCDGCDSAYHQWCHDPMIDKEVAENIHSSWFCGTCQHAKEVESLPMERRVSGAHLSLDERNAYLSMLSSKTLVALLLRATSLHPDLPLFAPDAKPLTKSKPGLASLKNTAPSTPPASQKASPAAQPGQQQFTNAITNNNRPHQHLTNSTHPHPPRPGPYSPHQHQATNGSTKDLAEIEDPYPDYSNEDGDPPATYPRPGRGPIKLRPTTDPEDLPWMVEDNSEVFSHFVADANGTLVAQKNRPGPWARGGGPGGAGAGRGAAVQKNAPAPMAKYATPVPPAPWQYQNQLQQLQSRSPYGHAVAGQQQPQQQQTQQMQQLRPLQPQPGPPTGYRAMNYNGASVYGSMR